MRGKPDRVIVEARLTRVLDVGHQHLVLPLEPGHRLLGVGELLDQDPFRWGRHRFLVLVGREQLRRRLGGVQEVVEQPPLRRGRFRVVPTELGGLEPDQVVHPEPPQAALEHQVRPLELGQHGPQRASR